MPDSETKRLTYEYICLQLSVIRKHSSTNELRCKTLNRRRTATAPPPNPRGSFPRLHASNWSPCLFALVGASCAFGRPRRCSASAHSQPVKPPRPPVWHLAYLRFVAAAVGLGDSDFEPESKSNSALHATVPNLLNVVAVPFTHCEMYTRRKNLQMCIHIWAQLGKRQIW